MKNIVMVLGALLISISTMAQATEGTVEFQKKQQSAAVLELPYPPDLVNAALNEFLSKKGKSKATDLKGFTTYRNTDELTGDSANADMYFKVERKSRKEKQTTVVSLLLTPFNGTAPDSGINYMTMDQAKTYLDQLIPTIEGYNLEQKIREMNDIITKSETRYKEMLKNDEQLEQNLTEIESKLASSKQQQVVQTNDIDSKKKQLAELVSKRQ